MMDMVIRFGQGRKVDAHYNGFTIQTDQSEKEGGTGESPSPTDLFLASIGTCAGLYAQAFCKIRKLDTTRLTMSLDFQRHPKSHLVEKVILQIGLPPGFPPKYEKALIRAVNQCHVKKHLEHPPLFEVRMEPTDGDQPG